MPNKSTSAAPIRIGYCLSLTGPVAGNSQSARLAHEIWRKDVKARGGLLGRSVELVCYDDRADATLVPGIYTRLMDEDKVDLVIGGYGTNTVLPNSRRRAVRDWTLRATINNSAAHSVMQLAETRFEDDLL